jgi:hypothetical protein
MIKRNKKMFDITDPDAAYEWVLSVLGIEGGRFIEEFVINCSNDFDKFFDTYKNKIEAIDINKLELVAIHVTSNNNNCDDIKNNGIKNLKKALSEKTELKDFLISQGIIFDIENKEMFIDEVKYDITYKENIKSENISNLEKKLNRIAHKIYHDYQVNGFFFNKDIYDYGTGIHMHPEFLVTISDFNKKTKGLADKWDKFNEGYVIKYKALISKFAYFTFYGDTNEYLDDYHNNWIRLKYWLLSHAVSCWFSDISSQVFAYMKPHGVILPERILEIVPANKWREHVLKYFN